MDFSGAIQTDLPQLRAEEHVGAGNLHGGHWRDSHRGGQGNKAWVLIQWVALENWCHSRGLCLQPRVLGPACSPAAVNWGFTAECMCTPHPRNRGPRGRDFPWGTKLSAHRRAINRATIWFSEISSEASLQKIWIQFQESDHQTDLAPRVMRQ